MTSNPCGYPGPGGACGSAPARLFLPGWRCPAHTPAALAGKPEPGAGRYCPPAVCWCGHCPPRQPTADRRVLVTGSRTWTDRQVIADALREHCPPGTVLVTGACPRGADAIAEQLWREGRGQTERHPADWSAGRCAGMTRNAAMVAAGAAVCLAFIRDNSPGASHTAALADLAGIPVHRYAHPGQVPPGLTIEAAGGALSAADAGGVAAVQQGSEALRCGGRGESGAAQVADVAAAVAVDEGVGVPAQFGVVQAPVTDHPVVVHQRDAGFLGHLPDASPQHRQRELLDAALAYTGRGWPVFVLGRTRRPVSLCGACESAGAEHDRQGCECLTCHGFYAATCDLSRIAQMLATVPAAVLAIRTGAASGLCVIDIDPRNGGQPDRNLMTATATVATGGGGWHLYYRHPGGATVRALRDRPGVDVKGDGGYVVAPPSIHPATGQRYRWVGDRPVTEMHPPLRSAVAPPRERPAPSASAVPVGEGCISSPRALLAAHLRAVQKAPEGRRRVTLYGAARGVARMVLAGAITAPDARAVLTAAGSAHPGLTPAQIRNAIDGAFEAEGAAA